jgi:hypothetical protein
MLNFEEKANLCKLLDLKNEKKLTKSIKLNQKISKVIDNTDNINNDAD